MTNLNNLQLKRIQSFLVSQGVARSLAHARKLTDSPARCRNVLLRVLASDGLPDDLADIAEFYCVDDTPLPSASVPIAEPVPAPDFSSASAPAPRRRGPGRRKSMELYHLRIDEPLLVRVRALGGNASAHIRQAVALYCDLYLLRQDT